MDSGLGSVRISFLFRNQPCKTSGSGHYRMQFFTVFDKYKIRLDLFWIMDRLFIGFWPFQAIRSGFGIFRIRDHFHGYNICVYSTLWILHVLYDWLGHQVHLYHIKLWYTIVLIHTLLYKKVIISEYIV